MPKRKLNDSSGESSYSKSKRPKILDDEDDDILDYSTITYSAGGDHSPIETLPVEILELIFSYIPLQEVLLNCQFVCRRWNIISSREKVK